MTAICKTWAVAAKDFKPLCNNTFEATNNTNECPVCVGPTVYDPTDGILLGQCGCSPTTGEIERNWTLKVEQGPIWGTLSATEQQLLSCYIGTFPMTNNRLSHFAATGIRCHSPTDDYYIFNAGSCTVSNTAHPEAYIPPPLEFLCEVFSYALAPAYLLGSVGNYCKTYPYCMPGTRNLKPSPRFRLNLAGPTQVFNGKVYRGFEVAQNYFVTFAYGGYVSNLQNASPALLCKFALPGKIPACQTSEPFSYELNGNAQNGDVNHWNKRFKVTLSGS